MRKYAQLNQLHHKSPKGQGSSRNRTKLKISTTQGINQTINVVQTTGLTRRRINIIYLQITQPKDKNELGPPTKIILIKPNNGEAWDNLKKGKGLDKAKNIIIPYCYEDLATNQHTGEGDTEKTHSKT